MTTFSLFEGLVIEDGLLLDTQDYDILSAHADLMDEIG